MVSTFTTEEISMIQELFLPVEPLKIVVDLHDDALLSDKDVAMGLADAAKDELLLDDATSVLLSPIGADDSFLHQFLLVDEKDAMAAFYTETAIDPFEPPSPVQQIKAEQAASASAASSSSSPLARPSDATLAKLRAKVDALTKMYYTRCHRLQTTDGSGDAATDVDVARVQRLHALEKLQRVTAHLTATNAQLVRDTTSVRQQHAAFTHSLERELSDAAHVEQIMATATESACAAARARASAFASESLVDGEAAAACEAFGWSCRTSKESSVLRFECSKTLAAVNTAAVLRKTTELLCTSETLSATLGVPVTVRAVKKLSASAAVVLYDFSCEARVDRVLALVFREELSDGRCLLASSSLNPPADGLAPTAGGSTSVRWMESCEWQLHEKKQGEAAGEKRHVVTLGGRRAYASAAEARAMALESVGAVVRWENAVLGPAFQF